MSLQELVKNNKHWGRSILIFFGVLFLSLFIAEVDYAFKNLKVFFIREMANEVSVEDSLQVLYVPDTLSIPSLQISAPIIYITKKGEGAYSEALARGVVHYPGTAMPGEFGNVYIFGHSSDLPWSIGQYKTIFAPLPQIQNGEKITLTDHAGRQFVYEVFETKVVMPNDLSVLSQYEFKEKLLSVQTSYPLGTALKRFIVLARLLED
ncbi:MAG: sortase [Patescibacteria group bacterium]|jgi:sortase A